MFGPTKIHPPLGSLMSILPLPGVKGHQQRDDGAFHRRLSWDAIEMGPTDDWEACRYYPYRYSPARLALKFQS